MDINYKKIVYSEEDKNEMFPLTKEEETSAVVLDSANLSNGKSFESEDEKILDFISNQKRLGKKGVYYDFIITKKGTVYKTAPDGRAAHALDFDLYSEKASTLLPKYCPQTDGKVFARDTTPDVIASSILIECDSEENTNIDNGTISDLTRYSLEDLLGYYIKEHNVNVSKMILLRCMFPKLDIEKETIGPSMYKEKTVSFILLTSHALSVTRNSGSIKLVESESIKFNK